MLTVANLVSFDAILGNGSSLDLNLGMSLSSDGNDTARNQHYPAPDGKRLKVYSHEIHFKISLKLESFIS